MGSIYAALLATSGNEVTAIDTNKDHINAINVTGLRVSGASGDRIANIQAFTKAPPTTPELIIIAVKGTQVESVIDQALAITDENSLILTIQNGLGSSDIIAKRFERP